MIILRVGILDADLIVAAVKGSEMMPIFKLVTQRFDTLSTRVSNRQDQIAGVGFDLYHGYSAKKRRDSWDNDWLFFQVFEDLNS